jgi:hypothetical protein
MLNYRLVKYETAFTFRILSQSRIIKAAIDSIGGTFVASNGYKIMIRRSPEVKVVTKRLFLRGSNTSKDDRIDRTWNFSSNWERDMKAQELEQAVAELISFANDYENSCYGIGADVLYANRPYIQYTSVFAPEARPFRIDAQGWGNNKPHGKPTYKSC